MTPALRFLGAGLLLTAACATGVLEDTDFEPSGSGGSTASQTGGATGDGGFGAGGFGEGGAGEGGMADGGMGGMAEMCSYDPPNTCVTAAEITTVAGDKNQAAQIKTGNTSMWFEVLIEEQDSSIFEEDLSYTVTLQSPPGMHWDLIVRQGPQDGAPNCNANNKDGIPQGNDSEAVSDLWDDDQGIGGEDDSVWLSIGVLYGSGDLCGDDANWTLSVQGHTL
jgi:hypothetical protein